MALDHHQNQTSYISLQEKEETKDIIWACCTIAQWTLAMAMKKTALQPSKHVVFYSVNNECVSR